VGFAILAFVAFDPNASISDLFGGNNSIGKTSGGNINAVDLFDRANELREIYPDTRRVPDEQIQNMAWDELVDERIFNSRYEDLGLSVTKQELADLLKGENPHPFALQVFSSLNETGTYDQFKAIEIVNDPSSHPQGELAVRQLIHAIKNDKINEKYSSLLQNAIHTPNWMAQNEFVKEYKTVNFDYVFLPYSLVNDEEIEVKESDLLSFAQRNKGKYAAKDGVILQYVAFNQDPSAADTTAQLIKLQNLKTNFQNASNPEQFASNNSNSQSFNRLFTTTMEYQTASSMKFQDEQIEQQILTANEGDVIGPVKTNGELLMVKVLEKKSVSDSARVRHILIPATMADPGSYAESKALADSLTAILKTNKSRFGEFVTEYSTDPGSKDKGGVYDYFPQGQMVPSFNDYSFNEPIGQIGVVETNYGFHIVEPLGRKGNSAGVKIAPILQQVRVTKDTRDAVYNQAKAFEQQAQSEESFETAAAEFGGAKTTASIEPNATTIPGIGQSYDIIRWANRNPVGSVRYFSNINGKTYVARVHNKTVDGEVDLEKHRTDLTNMVRNEKKATILEQRIEEAGGSAQSLTNLASSLGRTVQTATEAKFGGSGTAIGFEPELISSLFFRSEGQLDEPFDGRRGVYVVNVKGFNNVPPQDDFNEYKTTLNTQMQQKASIAAVRNAMIESGKIKDERYKTRR